METLTIVGLTGIVAIGGSFAKHVGKPDTTQKAIKVTVGIAAYTFAMLIFDEAAPKLAKPFAILFLITVLFYYTPAISKQLKGLLGT